MDFDGCKVENSFSFALQFAIKGYTASGHQYRLDYPRVKKPFEKYSSMTAMDGTTELQMLSFQAPKIRLLRSLSIENEAMQILDFAVFPRPEFDVPIFCANFFIHCHTINIIVLTLNPLHNVIDQRDYKEKYFKKINSFRPQLFPWGGKHTRASPLKFISPIRDIGQQVSSKSG
ncbi:hypothetical protein NC652_022408 [Populus alba x Populus x berolinensis]|nr:hypothetical protein NC652_022408 [Populus alba x Populus x berolinensis]